MARRFSQQTSRNAPTNGAHVVWFSGFSSSTEAGSAESLPNRDTVRHACNIILDDIARERAGGEVYELSLSLTLDAKIAELNSQHRGKHVPTDVLSFPLMEHQPGVDEAAASGGSRDSTSSNDALNPSWPDMQPQGGPDSGETLSFLVPGPLPVGDVVISSETCQRQAAEIGHSVPDEFWRLLVHGILHLFGYDHEVSPAEEQRMQQREDALLAELERHGV